MLARERPNTRSEIAYRLSEPLIKRNSRLPAEGRLGELDVGFALFGIVAGEGFEDEGGRGACQLYDAPGQLGDVKLMGVA